MHPLSMGCNLFIIYNKLCHRWGGDGGGGRKRPMTQFRSHSSKIITGVTRKKCISGLVNFTNPGHCKSHFLLQTLGKKL